MLQIGTGLMFTKSGQSLNITLTSSSSSPPEFVRPKKRLTFSSKDQQAAHPTQSKKRSASSLQDHLQPPHKKVLLQLRA